MGKSTRLRFSDVRHVYRIINEIVELGDDPDVWRPHLATELINLFDLQMATVYIMPMQVNVAEANVGRIDCRGLDEAATRMWIEYGRRGDLTTDPCTPVIMKILPNAFTMTRQMICDDHSWYHSGYYHDFKRVMRCDDMLLSIIPLPQLGILHGFQGERHEGQKPMGRRETVCASLIHQELARRWNRFLARSTLIEKQLSRRLNELLVHLRGAESEKEIAARMGLSPHTVHNHIRRLYAKFKVNSRAELMMIGGDRHHAGVPRLGVAGL
jgi:DNA-binding CsgD family transcriptional regulator